MISITKSRIVFAAAWWGYASSYFLRKPVGVLKPAMEKELDFSPSMLGCLDVALLLPYSLVQMFAGHWVSIYGARRVFAVCLWLSAVVVFPIGISSSSFPAVFLHIFLEGACQSLLWTCCVRLLDQWTDDEGRNTIMGVFTTCAFAGGALANFMAVWILTTAGWRYVYPVCSVFVAFVGVVVFFTCHDKTTKNVQAESQLSTQDTEAVKPVESTTLSWRDLWPKPGFADVCVCMLCLKLTRYFVYMWLPYLYTKEFGYGDASAATASTGFEVGGVFGSMLIGVLIDSHLNGDVLRGVVYAILFAVLSFFCFTFSSSLSSYIPLWLPQLFFIALYGAVNAGSDAMMSTSVPAKLGAAYGGSTAAIAGFVNGFGTFGSLVQGPVAGYIGGKWGWMTNLFLMLGINIVAAITAVRAYKARPGG